MSQNKRQIIGVALILFEVFLIWSFYQWLIKRPNKLAKPPLQPTVTKSVCSRNTAYPMLPEFSRSISLLNQRYSEHGDAYQKTYQQITNCYSIEYADLPDAEGVFYFDKNTSSSDKFVIKVNRDYKSYDDLSTAFLLSHELTHARQYADYLLSGKNGDCVDQEAEAFYQQLKFGSYLNEEESKSIISRAEKRTNNNTQLLIYAKLLDMSWYVIKDCERVNKSQELINRCYSNKMSDKLRSWVSQSPEYRKQCGL